MKFADPIYLIIGAIIAITLIVLRIWLTKRNQRELTRFAAARLIPRLTQGISTPRRQAKATLFILGIAFLFVALARPQWGTTREEVRIQGIDILIALDTSRSMLASDVSPNRLERSKLAIHDFTSSLEAARIGLLPFAGDAFLLCPLTLDRSAFESSLNDLDTRIIPEGGTDIARAIKESEKVFEKGANQKILILITDGEDLEGGALDAARNAQKKGITIHTVGVGTPSGNLILLDNGRPLTDRSGKAVQSKLDDKTLREIAQITAGMYAPLVGDTAGLEQIRKQQLDQVTKSELESQTKEIPIERYQWPLALGLILLALEFCISSATRNKKTNTATQAIAALAFLAIITPIKASESTIDPRTIYNEGTQLWEEGKFSEAEQKFHDSLSNADLPLQTRAYYNMGNSRYRQGQQSQQKDAKKTIQLWEKAIQSYESALKLDPDDQDATFNKKLVQKQLDELKKQEEQKKNQDQKNKNKKDQKENKDQKDDQKQQDKDGKKEDNQEKKDSKSDKENEDQKEQSKQDSDSKDQKQDQKQDQEGQEEGKEKDEKNPQQDKKQQQGDEPGKEDSDDKNAQPPKKSNPSDKPKDGNAQKKGDQQANPTEAQAIPAEMTKEQAKRLLESLTNEEGKIRIAIPRRSDKKGRPQRPKRDW